MKLPDEMKWTLVNYDHGKVHVLAVGGRTFCGRVNDFTYEWRVGGNVPLADLPPLCRRCERRWEARR